MENKNRHNEDPLEKLPKNAGFDVPKGYFDDVEDQFSIKLREASFPDDVGFEVPSDYFDSLEDQILSKVELPKQGKVISLRARILRVASVAAVFALLFVGYQFINQEVEPSSDEIAAWMDLNLSDIDTDDLLNELDETDEFSEINFLDNSIENNSIETYFDQNDTYILIEESQGLFDEIN
jgi:hypothetical protein